MKTLTGLLGTVVRVTVLLLFVGAASAAHAVEAGNETFGLEITTSATCDGIFQEHADGVMTRSDGDLNSKPALEAGETVGTTGYYEDTVAVDGNTTYVKTFEMNNENQVNSESGQNVDSQRVVTFDSNGNGGRMTSDEGVFVESVSSGSESENSCNIGPFEGDGSSSTPASDEIVAAGSRMDVTEVSVVSQASSRVVSDSGAPVSLDYSFNAQGVNQTEGGGAVGSASVYVDANVMQGNGNETELGSTTSYEEVTSVDGVFTLAKDISYSSSPTE
ncbi:MAG: hypothetical protein NT074_04380 [Methanomicrobiales archaeon]|jgi:hypothetical protein|nr:hypothetical protein [Methanomicrobiales archaeon]